jgi:hypothetical protein
MTLVKKPRPKVHTVRPDKQLPFNLWMQYISAKVEEAQKNGNHLNPHKN